MVLGVANRLACVEHPDAPKQRRMIVETQIGQIPESIRLSRYRHDETLAHRTSIFRTCGLRKKGRVVATFHHRLNGL